jgi:hypothetical protein
MIRLTDLEEIIVPHQCVADVYSHLREFGLQGFEGVALWAGVQRDSIFEVTTTIIPKQQASKTFAGLQYAVDGDELHRINVYLYQNKLTLFAQIHSHPTDAYHSETDDDYSIITAIGGFSIVIPDFASGPLDVKKWVVYQLAGQQQWYELLASKVQTLFKIIG